MRDELDKILDDALATYTAKEPRAGFSASIVARVHAANTTPRWNWLSYATAVLALISLTATVVMWRNEEHGRLQAPRVEQVRVAPAVLSLESPRAAPRAPRQDLLTREQRALLSFAQLSPETARRMAQPDKPLEIEEINIRPIQIDSLEIGEIR